VKKTTNILIIFAILFVAVVIIVSSFIYNSNDNPNTNVINQNEELTTFTATEIGLKVAYPKNWNRYYNYTDDFGFALELKSDTQTTITDPLTNQIGTGSLITVSVYKQPNFDKLTLSDWINKVSVIKDEQERINKDIQSYTGYQQWIWHKQNPYASSSFTYYVDNGNDIWEFRADVNNDDPSSVQFKNSKDAIQLIFDSIELD